MNRQEIIQTTFQTISTLIRTSPPIDNGGNKIHISDNVKLKLYGYFKVATAESRSDYNMGPRPSIFDPVARAKYDAHLSSLSECNDEYDAMCNYVKVAAEQENSVGRECKKIYDGMVEKLNSLNEDREGGDKEDQVKNDYVDKVLDCKEKEVSESSDDINDVHQTSNQGTFSNFFSIMANIIYHLNSYLPSLIPRGQLDISIIDLLYALYQCVWDTTHRFIFHGPIMNILPSFIITLLNLLFGRFHPDQRGIWYETQIEHWVHKTKKNDENHQVSPVVGLSVRSLLDLYLSVRNFPSGSEVIIVPGISIQGMLDVLTCHDLNIVPIDILGDAQKTGVWGIDFEAVKDSITEKTVAVLVVHPFGARIADEYEMKNLRNMVEGHGLEIWEDCAQCFDGVSLGSEFAHVSFFSFGPIKTCTALGGGLAVVRNVNPSSNVGEQSKIINDYSVMMKRMQESLYKQQSNLPFFGRVVKCTMFHLLSFSRLGCGVVKFIIELIGWDYNEFVVSSLRGFSTVTNDDLMKQLRQRPCPALLALLYRRLRYSDATLRAVVAQRRRCCSFETRIIDEVAGDILIPKNTKGRAMNGWIFPVIVENPEQMSKVLLNVGIDAPCGLTQLKPVKPNPPRINDTFERILYLPVTTKNFSPNDQKRLIKALKYKDENNVMSKSPENHSLYRSYMHPVIVLVAVFFQLCFSDRHIFPLKMMLRLAINLAIWMFLAGSSVLFFVVALSRYMGPIYVDSSNTFAKYCDMLFKSPFDVKCVDKTEESSFLQSQTVLQLETTKIPEIHSDKGDSTLCLVTGATGFIGSLLLRELLLHRKSLGLNGVAVIVRTKRGKSAINRVKVLLSQPMFGFLDEEEKSSLVHVIEGDVTLPNCGLTEQQLSSLSKLNVQHVFHAAAAVSFQQPLEQAAISNITSSLQMQKLTKNIWNRAVFVYISTAFVHGGNTGTKSQPLPESLFSLHPFEPLELYKSMLGTQSYASAAMNELGFPNTYTFSKSVCEHLLCVNQSVETIIIRPSIVGPSVHEPYEGWAGEKPSTIVAAACLYLKFPYNMWCFGEESVPFIPADVVCRFAISKAFKRRDDYSLNSSKDFGEEKKEVSPDENTREYCKQTTISTVAWDAASHEKSSFSWVSYAFAITHLGSVCGHVNRVVAYAGLLLSTKLFPWFNFKHSAFQYLHAHLIRAPFDYMLYLCKWLNLGHNLRSLSPLLDLPILFFPFANQKFYFKSDLLAPENFNGERYMFSCAVAAHRFILMIEEKRRNGNIRRTNLLSCTENTATVINVAGSNHNKPISDLLWSLTQPNGNFVIRVGGWVLAKIFRNTASQIELDAASFVQLARTLSTHTHDAQPHVVIAPTHRSFYDFLIVSYICFSYPELGLKLPFIAAADDFRSIPIIGWLARSAQAFFLKRGKKQVDPDLKSNLNKITNTTKSSTFIEVFIEGKRSRYRNFSNPKTGFLRCLADGNRNYLIIPVTISYEALPDEKSLIEQAKYGNNGLIMNLKSLMHWLYRAFTGNICIGRVHVSTSGVLEMPDTLAIKSLCEEIQRSQKSRIMISDFHVKAASLALSLPVEMILRGLEELQVGVWPSFGTMSLAAPSTRDLQWVAMLHFAHIFAPFLMATHPEWAVWLSPSPSNLRALDGAMESTNAIVKRLMECFDAADDAVEQMMTKLRLKGFANPSREHIIQYQSQTTKIPIFLIGVALQRHSSLANDIITETPTDKSLRQNIIHNNISDLEPLFHPSSSCNNPDMESLGAWGYNDSYFVLNVTPDGSKCVVMKGDRYSISGKKLPKLAKFVEDQLNVKISPAKLTFSGRETFRFVPNIASKDVQSEVAEVLRDGMSQTSIKYHDLARHGTGHTQEDMYGLRSGSLGFRLPDLVVWPNNSNEVEALVSMAAAKSWCIIPFGGGTNVTHATHCPDKTIDPRTMISVDMKSMNRVIWVNKEDGLAHVEAGITGRKLIEHMKKLGLTIGHEPDSYEFSTLGGWIATKASGMKQNRYGNIEDIVKEVTVVGANGIISNIHLKDNISFGRVSAGVDFKSIMLGSEGCLGIITSAVIKVWPIAEITSYESVLLSNFDVGLRFAKAISKMRGMKPASVRLLDNAQFKLGQALKPELSWLEHIKNEVLKQVGFTYGQLSEKSIVCVTITFEGSQFEVQMQKKVVRDIASSHCGILAGSSVGRAGYDLTFAIAYLRDFALNYDILGESFEAFVPWSVVKEVIDRTKQRIEFEHRKRALPGTPFVCCRVTQLYDEGVCVYFYFCMNINGVTNPSRTFASIEECARQEILDSGGSLSHHHGVGKLRAPFICQIFSYEHLNTITAIKNAVDPNNIFGARNGVLFTKLT